MKITIDFDNQVIGHSSKKNVVVAVVRGTKRKTIMYNSGLIYLDTEQSRDELIAQLSSNPSLEIHIVDVINPTPPDTQEKGYWCPYCKNWEYWKVDGGGYKRCPICGISDADYYVRKYNKLWVSKMKSKKDKKYQEKIIDNSNKRRKRK